MTNAGFPKIAVGAGRCGTNALQMGTSATAAAQKGVNFGSTTPTVGFALYIVSHTVVGLGGPRKIFEYGTALGPQLALARSDDGSLSVYREDIAAVLLGTSAPDVTRVGDWYFIEFQAVIHPSAGSVEVRVNGSAVLTLAGIDTVSNHPSQTTSVSSIKFTSDAVMHFYVEDLYALDSTGTNTTFLGDVRVEYLQPTADGATLDWSLVGAPARWQAVDDGDTPDDDTDYIGSQTAGQINLAEYEDTGLPSGSIFGVQVSLYARKTDSGLRSLQPVIRHAAVNNLGTAQNPSFPSYTYLHEAFNTNPGTSAAWTIADVNNAQFGVRVST